MSRPEYQPGADGALRVQMGEDVRWFMVHGTGIGVTLGGVRNAGATARWSDPVRIASFRHWPAAAQQEHVRRYSPQWTESERAQFAERNHISPELVDAWAFEPAIRAEDGAA